MRTKINTYFSSFDFDVRKSGDARFVDQKCTPDIVCFIADCIENLIATKPEFSIKDIWQSQYFIQNVRVLFNKPWATDKNVVNEYNKVLSQPLKLLAYAQVLKVDKPGRSLIFSVKNDELLDYISRKDRNSYNFLYCYFMKVMKDSGMASYFEEYKQGTATRDDLYDKYFRLICGNTRTRSKLDITRMFHKVFNIYAVEHELNGSTGKKVYFSDLMYNKVNWRDLKKDKTASRRSAAQERAKEKQEIIDQYYVQKAINTLRKIQLTSEVHDRWSAGDATQAHHIFPKSDYPRIAHYIENLVMLTPTQHNTKAHPKNKTKTINRDYQLVCLLAKSDTIEHSIQEVGEKFYSKENFLFVIKTGLKEDIPTETPFSDIKTRLRCIYNAA